MLALLHLQADAVDFVARNNLAGEVRIVFTALAEIGHGHPYRINLACGLSGTLTVHAGRAIPAVEAGMRSPRASYFDRISFPLWVFIENTTIGSMV